MNTYLQTQERRKFRANAREVNKGKVSLKELLLCVVIGLLAVIGTMTVMAAVTAGIIY
jgi:hypothetical protein